MKDYIASAESVVYKLIKPELELTVSQGWVLPSYVYVRDPQNEYPSPLPCEMLTVS